VPSVPETSQNTPKTEGTLYMDGERFNELQVYRFRDDKHDRGFKTLYAF
jgi:hypothetical protein